MANIQHRNNYDSNYDPLKWLPQYHSLVWTKPINSSVIRINRMIPFEKLFDISINIYKIKKTILAGFEPARENPMDFKSIALTTRPQYLIDNKGSFRIFNDLTMCLPLNKHNIIHRIIFWWTKSVNCWKYELSYIKLWFYE